MCVLTTIIMDTVITYFQLLIFSQNLCLTPSFIKQGTNGWHTGTCIKELVINNWNLRVLSTIFYDYYIRGGRSLRLNYKDVMRCTVIKIIVGSTKITCESQLLVTGFVGFGVKWVDILPYYYIYEIDGVWNNPLNWVLFTPS